MNISPVQMNNLSVNQLGSAAFGEGEAGAKSTLQTIGDTLYAPIDYVKDAFTHSENAGLKYNMAEGAALTMGGLATLGIGYLGSVLAGKAYNAIASLFTSKKES